MIKEDRIITRKILNNFALTLIYTLLELPKNMRKC